MPGTTPTYNLPYPINSDPVNVATDIYNLATALDSVALPSLVDVNITIQGIVATGETVLPGDPVFVESVALVGDTYQYTIKVANNTVAGQYAIGLAQSSGTQGALVKVVVSGPLYADLNTSAFTVGDILYVGDHTAASYNLTSTVPVSPSYAQPIAMVINDNGVAGRVQVIPGLPQWIRITSAQTWTGTQTFNSILVADQAALSNDGNAANTRFVQQELASYAPLSANNTWTGNNSFVGGTISGTTAPVGTATNILASTEFVKNALDNRLPTYAALTGAAFTGSVTAPNLLTTSSAGIFHGDAFSILETQLGTSGFTPVIALVAIYTKQYSDSNLYIDFNINGVTKSGNCGVKIWLENNSGDILMTACSTAGYTGNDDISSVGSVSGSWVVPPETPGDFSRIYVKFSNPFNTGSALISYDGAVSTLSVREIEPRIPTIFN